MARCRAHSSRTGKRCKRDAIRGGTVCRTHGGAAPQVKAKAQERLAALVDPALGRLLELIAQKKHLPTALGAVKDALDRNGIGLGKPAAAAHGDVNVQVIVSARDELASRLARLAARGGADRVPRLAD
jgi:hypothetical protein